MPDHIRVGILGDFNPEFHSHRATNAAIQHSAAQIGIQAETQWLPTPILLEATGEHAMEACDGLWASPGSPYASFEGSCAGSNSRALGIGHLSGLEADSNMLC